MSDVAQVRDKANFQEDQVMQNWQEIEQAILANGRVDGPEFSSSKKRLTPCTLISLGVRWAFPRRPRRLIQPYAATTTTTP